MHKKNKAGGKGHLGIIFIRKKENWWFTGFFKELERNDNWKPNDCSPNCPGMLLATLWILTCI